MGLLLFFLMYGNVLAGLLSFGLSNASYRFYFQMADNLDEFRNLHSTNLFFILCVFLISGLFVFATSGWISLILFDNKISGTLLSISFISGCLENFISYLILLLTAQNRSTAFFGIAVSRITINTLLSLFFIFGFSLTYMARIYATLITQIFIITCLLILTRKLIVFRMSFPSLKKNQLFSPIQQYLTV